MKQEDNKTIRTTPRRTSKPRRTRK